MREERGLTKSVGTVLYAAVTVLVMALLAYSMFFKKDAESVTYRKDLLGTVVEITLFEGDRLRFDSAAKAAFAEVKRLQDIFSNYNPESETTKLSKAAGEGPVKVSSEMMEVLTEALKAAKLSGGAFDPTVGALGKLWGYSGEKGSLPEKTEFEKALKLVDYRGIESDAHNSTAALKNKGMAINLGGIAKGYIAGKVAEVLKTNGVERAIVKAGGDMAVFQPAKSLKPFIIGIQDPRIKGKLIGEAHVMAGSVSTSGDYERFFMKDGVRYHHILDPKTGMPAGRARSATVVAPDGAFADALSTALFVMGAENGIKLAESLGIGAVIVDAHGKVRVSKGFKGKIY